MPANSRFLVASHLLAALALSGGEAVPSEQLAVSVNTNPAVVRRLLARLNRAGLTRGATGPGGGATLARLARDITLLDVYRAVDEPTLFAPPPSSPNPDCIVGCHIARAMEGSLEKARKSMEASLAETTIAQVAARIRKLSPK